MHIMHLLTFRTHRHRHIEPWQGDWIPSKCPFLDPFFASLKNSNVQFGNDISAITTFKNRNYTVKKNRKYPRRFRFENMSLLRSAMCLLVLVLIGFLSNIDCLILKDYCYDCHRQDRVDFYSCNVFGHPSDGNHFL